MLFDEKPQFLPAFVTFEFVEVILTTITIIFLIQGLLHLAFNLLNNILPVSFLFQKLKKISKKPSELVLTSYLFSLLFLIFSRKNFLESETEHRNIS